MSLSDLYGIFYPGFGAEYLENFPNFILYKGESFEGNLSIGNGGTESVEDFDVDLYISTDSTIDTSDYFLGQYNFADGIDGKSEDSTDIKYVRDSFTRMRISVTLPNPDSTFWSDQDIYYFGAIIDPDNKIVESEENNNSESPDAVHDPDKIYDSYSSAIYIEESNLPVVSFTPDENTLNINLSKPAPENGFIINYKNLTKENYLDRSAIPAEYQDLYSHRYIGNNFYDPESKHLFIQKENYYDLADYKYYDADGGYYDPAEDKYYNADGSFYDVSEKLFYDVDGNSTELTDNSAEYNDSSSSPRHYLPTGSYISLISGIFYDARGGYIDETKEEYFFREGENGLGNSSARLDILTTRVGSLEYGFGFLPKIATPNLDYEIILGENIANITDSTITIVPGETNATIDFNFLSDSVFDPNETIEFELVEDEQKYIVGRSSLYRYFEPKLDVDDLKNPRSGDLNFSIDKNATPGTIVGQINFSDPQGDELNYSLIAGKPNLDSTQDDDDPNSTQYYNDLDLDPKLIETSNQDLDGDGIHPFNIDSNTGTITLTDFEDLDREAANNFTEGKQSQLYNSGYYQLFVRVADKIPTANDLRYSTADLYDTSVVNVQVVDRSPIPESDKILGSLNDDILDGLTGSDTIQGLEGDDTLNGDEGNDFLLGDSGNDILNGDDGKDFLNSGSGEDILNGGNGEDLAIAMTGNDTLNGDEGDDFLVGMTGNDHLNGDDGEDFLNGGLGDDILRGGANPDILLGQDGNDTLYGDAGDDFLKGGAGINYLHGNGGADIFALKPGLGQDFIVDFENGIDLIGITESISFEELNIVYMTEDGATTIQNKNNNQVLAVLEGIEADLIGEEDFTVQYSQIQINYS
ncbi:CARDB domain-containing protein [Pleurocapsa sp. PCC 7319]|uniref:CARDB domain-containing protein n=1 Tax=Pleurocapsa sp. PCC 7319 TaxID=118161 RepID=UPI00034AEF52|nr:CARDB domain-containing protein [Pleurocapsa sp. PCC 7319]